MKYAEFTIGSDKIEFLNSFLGIESVLVNNRLVSRKFSFNGAKHLISQESGSLALISKYKPFNKSEIGLILMEENKTLESLTVKLDSKHRFYWQLIGIAIGIVVFYLGKGLL